MNEQEKEGMNEGMSTSQGPYMDYGNILCETIYQTASYTSFLYTNIFPTSLSYRLY